MQRRKLILGLLVIIGSLMLVACENNAQESVSPTPPPTPQVSTVAEGLINPIGMAVLPDGSLFIAEAGTGERDLSAGLSLMTTEGVIGRYVSGFASGRDSGDLSGMPLVALAPEGDKLYLGNFGVGHLWTIPLPDGALELPEAPFEAAQLDKAMLPLNNVKLINPFDITFDVDGKPIVTDASGNGVAKENDQGTTTFFHRFAPLVDPTNEKLTIDPVPTGITRVGDEYFVTLTGGCPFPEAGGELVAIDEQRHQRTVVDNLNMPIDVAVGSDGTIWVLEFATFMPGASCFTGMGYQQNSGRLSRLVSNGTLETVVDGLNFPGAVLPLPDGSLYVSEVFNGRLIHITFAAPEAEAQTAFLTELRQKINNLFSAATPAPVVERDVADLDAALTAVAKNLNLHPYPGRDLREGDTALARLGQDLFFDPILSGDQNISCATCHHPALAMGDGRVLPIGTGGSELGPARDFVTEVTLGPDASQPRRVAGETDPQTGTTIVSNPFSGSFIPRNSPTIINSALLPSQFWDGRVESNYADQRVHTQEAEVNAMGLSDALAAQALFPVASLHEMAGATLGDLAPQQIRRALLARIAAVPAYRERFLAVFGTEVVTAVEIAEAIAAFERRFIMTASPWDDYLAGDKAALTAQQKRGALLFFGQLQPQVNCAQCHSGDLFTDMQFHNLLVPQLGPGKGHGENGREDWGRSRISFDRRDQYAFRTPSLRNVALTAPYFHSGAYADLAGVIRHHADIWGSAANYDPSAHLPPSFYSSLRPFQPDKQGHSAAPALAAGLPLTADEIADLVAFLQALSDPEASDLTSFLPQTVPSGLPLDPLPQPTHVRAKSIAEATAVAPDESPASTTPFGWQFVEATDEANLHFQHGAFQQALYEDPAAMMGGGLCWLDYDNDGWLDLYLVNSFAEEERDYWLRQGGLPRNKLLRNVDGRFQDSSLNSGADLSLRSNGCVAADFNLDGWTDLFLTADGPNALLWNNGDGTFSEGAVAAGVAASEWNSTAVVGDLNNDGWPDLFVGSYIDLDYKIPRPSGAFPQDYYGLADHLYLSDGLDHQGHIFFREIALAAGLNREERALGAILSDLDNDGDLDLYIANDGQANRLYENQPWPGGIAADPAELGFRFHDLSATAEVGDTGSGMGVTSGDYDGDGFFDLFVTNWEAELNALYRNEMAQEGLLNFRYSTYRIGMRGLGNNMTGWGTTWADFDHDGDLDLLTVNGRVPITNRESDPELVRLYGNRLMEGFPGEYREWTQLAGLKEVGPLLARGSAVADFDNDGDLDVAINQIGGTAVLLRNDGSHENGNWLEVVVEGFYPGTMVTVTLPDGRQLKREWHSGSSYLSSEDPRLHFGLGEAALVSHLHVLWPNGHTAQFENVAVNATFHVAP